MRDEIVILNYSDEFSVEIARRLRAEQVYARIVPADTDEARLRAMAPRGIILSGAAAGAEQTLDPEIAALGVPVLALGHTAHLLLAALGGASADVAVSGRKALIQYGDSPLFDGVTDGERYLAQARTMMLPPEVQMTASAGGCTIAFEDAQKRQYGVQFELERNDPEGSAIIKNFVRDICGCSAWWSLDAARAQAEDMLDAAAKRGGFALCAVSGGVDSTVAAVLTHRAFGERMTAVLVDTGLMRDGEVAQVQEAFEALGVPFRCVDRAAEVLGRLEGKRGAEEKRAVVTAVLREEMLRLGAAHGGGTTLVLGTNYSDFLYCGDGARSWDGLEVAEPLLELFKDEVRAIATQLGIDERIAARKPFPALGLGARIVGEINGERLHALRMAERAFSDEIREAGLERKLYKYFPILVADGSALGGEVMVLRAVTLSGGQLMPARLPYDLVERTVARIQAMSPAITRVFYDQTPTPVGQETFI